MCIRDSLETGQVDLIVVNSPNAYLGNVPNVKKIKDFQDVFIADKAFEELKGKKLSFKEDVYKRQTIHRVLHDILN